MVLKKMREMVSKHSKITSFMIISGVLILLGLIVAAVFAPFLTAHSPLALSFEPLQPPTQEHPFGTDILGRDILSRVMYGGRVSISVAILSILIALSVSVPLGAIFTYIGGKMDKLMILIMDAHRL